MNRARSPLANLLLGAASLTPKTKMGGNLSPFSNVLKSSTNQSQNLETHMTPTLNGP
jgi:hypothetical protein